MKKTSLRGLVLLGLVLGAWAAGCVDGRHPTALDTRSNGHILIAPRFEAIAGSPALDADINRIRVTVRPVGKDSILTVFTQDVDPNATEWTLDIPIEFASGEILQVTLVVELINVAGAGEESVLWSGQTEATPGTTSEIQQVPVYPGPPDNLTVQSVTIAEPARSALLERDTIRLSGSVTGGGGSVQLFWSSLDPSIATVDAGGLVTATLPGSAGIALTVGPKADTVSLTVVAVLAGIQLDPDSLNLAALSDTGTVQATAVDPRGAPVPGVALTWFLADSTVVRHLGSGRFLALRNGRTSLTVTGVRSTPVNPVSGRGMDGTVAAVVADTAVRALGVIVVEQAAGSLDLTPDSVTFRSLGDTATFSVSALDAFGTPVPAAVLHWSVRDTLVASVDGGGRVRAMGNGSTHVLVTSGTARDSALVRVTQQARTILVEPKVDTLRTRGDTVRLVATVRDARGSVVAVGRPSWFSADTAVARVDSTGLVTAVASGSTRVWARSGNVADTASIVVRFPAATVTVSPTSLTLGALGQVGRLSAAVLDPYGDTVRTPRITWSSSNAGVATVDSTGLVRAVGNGSAVVTAASGGASGSADVTVAQKAVSVVLDPAVDTIHVGDTLLVAATARDSLGQAVTAATVTWASSNPAVASVSSTGPLLGQVVAVDTGSVIVQATTGGVTGQASILVTLGTPVAMDVIPDSATVRSGETKALAGVLYDAGGRVTLLPDTLSVLWSSQDTSIAEVDANGVVTGRTVGQVFIRANAGVLTDSARIVVIPGTAVVAAFFQPDADTTVSSGDTVGVAVEGFDARNNYISSGWTLSVADPSVLTLLGDSAFVAQRTDTTTLMATLDTAHAILRVFVTQGAVVAVSLLTPSADTTMTAGDHVKLDAEALDAFGNMVPAAFTFASTASAVVRVSADTAYAEAAGSASVIATANGVADTVVVTVSHGPAVSINFTTPATDTVKVVVGDTLATSVQAADALGNLFQDGATYTSSAPANVAVDAAGVVVVGASPYTSAWIVTHNGAVADSFYVDVIPGIPVNVTAAPDTATLTAVGGTVDLSGRVTALDAGAAAIVGLKYKWTSLDTTVVKVDSLGVVTALAKNDTAGVVVEAGGYADTVAVAVQIPPGKVDATPDLTPVDVSASTPFAALVEDSLGNAITGATVTWSSIQPGVASVDAAGSATGIAPGVTGIVATSGAVADTATLVVLGPSDLLAGALPLAGFHASAAAGEVLPMAVILDMTKVGSDGDLGSLQFTLDYDPAVLQLDSASAGVSGSATYNAGTPGKVSFAMASATPQGSASLTLLTVYFTVKSVPVGTESGFLLSFPAVPTSTTVTNYSLPIVVNGGIRVSG